MHQPGKFEPQSGERVSFHFETTYHDIEVDGCVDFDNIPIFLKNGATTLILGIFTCFVPGSTIRDSLLKVKEIIRV